MFRAILFYILILPFTAWYSLRALASILFNKGKIHENWAGRVWGKRVVALMGLDVEADLSSIEPNGHYVFMSNHLSNFDIWILSSLLWDNRLRFVAKKSLFDIPLLGRAMKKAGHISIDRENRRSAMKSVQDAVDSAKSGISPLIFPEGTRNSAPDELMKFRVGGMILALKCGLPVVPLIITGTDKVLPKKKILVRRRPVRVKALKPIDISKYTLKDRDKFKDDMWTIMNKAYLEMLNERS